MNQTKRNKTVVYTYSLLKRGPDHSLPTPTTHPFVVFDIGSGEHCVIGSLGQLFIVIAVEIFEIFISHVESLW